MRQVLFDDLATTYVLSAILTTIGLDALVLSVAGVYGLVSYAVVQRRREIGVRMALGAGPASLVRLIVAQSTRPVAMGSLFGLLAAVALALLMAAGMPEVDPRDPVSYVGVILLILASALLATLVPARRAASINPVEALRAD
jgi:ABC-type antimicrobial peptide transport system permease subunit